jgi:hypothetical protein
MVGVIRPALVPSTLRRACSSASTPYSRGVSFHFCAAMFLCCLASSLLLCAPLTAQTQAPRRKLTTDIKELVLENRLLSRKFAVDQGWLRTAHFTNLLTGENAVVNSPEFQIQFENQPVLSSDDFVAEYYSHVILAGEVKRTLFTLTDKRQRLQLELEYTLGPNDFFMRKRLRLYPLQKNLPRLLSVSVEALKTANLKTVWPRSDSSLPGREESEERRGDSLQELLGQPLFINESFFWGIEHPAGRNRLRDGVLSCAEHPGNRLPASGFESHAVVAGVSPRGEIADWFLRYIDGIRLPAHPLTILKVPADRNAATSLLEVLRHKVEAIPRSLERSDRSLVDAVVLDAGWWRKSSSQPLDVSTLFGRLASLSEALKAGGSGLGMYLPLKDGGFGEVSFGSQLPDTAPEGSGNSRQPLTDCSLADPKHWDALKVRLKELYQANSFRFVRHDLNEIACPSAGQGQRIEANISRQAAADALIELLRLERSLNSDLYVSLEGREAPSPWWLQYANDVGPGDIKLRYLRMDLSPYPRDWQIHHEASALQEYLGGGRFQFPLSRLAAGSLRQAVYASPGLKEPEEVWADAVTEYLGRGQDLTELNFDPEQLDPKAWEILRRALYWKASRQPVFHRSQMIGGAVEKAEPYGYLHWNATQAVVVLRNPAASPAETSFRLPKSLRGSLRMLQSYPRCRAESQLLKPGDIVNTSLEGLETRVLEINAEGTWETCLPQDVDFILSSDNFKNTGEGRIALKVFPETPEIQFSHPQSIADLRFDGGSISLDSLGRVQLPDSPQLKAIVDALKSFTQTKAEVGIYAKRGVQLTLPAWNGVRSHLSIWLFQPSEQRGNFPLYVTLDRKQVNLNDRVTFTPPGEALSWSSHSLPLKFDHQVLLDWAVKDVKNVSLYLWWEIEAPRPVLEFNYRLASGKTPQILPPLLASPQAANYVVRIPLEVDKQQRPADMP